MFCGSATWRRWKSAPAGNSSVSVSPASSVGVASASRLATGIERSRTVSTIAPLPRVRDLLELELGGRRGGRRRPGRRRLRGSAGGDRADAASGVRRMPAASAAAALEQLDAVGERLAREIGVRPRHLHERELEREPWVAALAHVLDRDGEQVDQPEHGRLRELVRLLAQELLRLLGDRERLGHVAHVLDEQEVPQVLEQVGHEAAEVLPLLGELLDEDERAGRVAVDDHVAEPEQRVLLDRADELEDGLRVDRAVRRRRELVERRDRVAERAARAARDQRERRVRRLDALAVGDAAEQRDELARAAVAGRRTSGSASARSGAPSRDRSCRRRRGGAAEAPRSA